MSAAPVVVRPRVLLEAAVGTAADAQTAQAAGADRIELNAALELGGLTPSLGTLIEVKRTTRLPVVVMIRPRGGGFVYGDADFAAMRRDAELALERGADGLAFGVLTGERTIDLARTRELARAVGGGCQTVFHRAFDLTPDPLEALDRLIDLGVTRVLTSGQRSTAMEGADRIRRLIDHARGRIEVLPGGGITSRNVAALIAATGAGQVHGSFSVRASDPAEPVCEGEYPAVSAAAIRETRGALARL